MTRRYTEATMHDKEGRIMLSKAWLMARDLKLIL